MVIVKEVNPNYIDREDRVSQKISWEIGSFKKLKQLNVKGIINIIDSGEKWFASSLEIYGSLKWHLVGIDDLTGSHLGEILDRLYMDIKDLDRPVDQQNWPVYQSIFVQSLNILSELHQNNYVNRDLHRDNILVSFYDEQSQKIEVKICDMDSSRKIDGKEPPFFLDEHFKGSYIAPERYQRPRKPNEDASDEAWKKYYEDLEAYHGLPAGDVYAIAAIIANILLRKSKSIGGETLRKAIIDQAHWKDNFKQFLLKALSGAKFYQDRPSAEEFARYLSNLAFNDIEKKQRRENKWTPLLVFLLSIAGIAAIIFFAFNNGTKENLIELSGILKKEQLQWRKEQVYQIMDDVYVVNDTLEIEAGTTVYVEDGKGIYITRNAQIQAEGTQDAPITFTSISVKGIDRDTIDRVKIKPWKGINIYGQATINGDPDSTFTQYIDEFNGNKSEGFLHRAGGTYNEHSNGTLRFVRIEYPGYSLERNVQFNGLTLLGVGNNTIIENILIADAEDDGIEIIGGSVNLSNIIIHNFEDDAIDWEYGWNGRVQNILVLGRPFDIKRVNTTYSAIRADKPQKERAVFNAGNGRDNTTEDDRLIENPNLGNPMLKNITVYLAPFPDSIRRFPFLRCELDYNLPVIEDAVIVSPDAPLPDNLLSALCRDSVNVKNIYAPPINQFGRYGEEDFYKPVTAIPSPFDSNSFMGAFEARGKTNDWDTGKWAYLGFGKKDD